MDQYLLIPFLGEWPSIYQLFWCSPGVQGFDTLPNQEDICCVRYCWHQQFGFSLNTVFFSFLARKQTRWCPPNVIDWFINPSNYRYITNKNQSEIGVMFTNWTLSNGGTTLNLTNLNQIHPLKCDFGMPIIITSASQPAKKSFTCGCVLGGSSHLVSGL